MNELLKDIRHVIRHFIPGFTCTMMFVLSMLLAGDITFQQLICLITKPPVLIVFFVISAILGYFFATVYFGVRWCLIFGRALVVNTVPLINNLNNAHLINIHTSGTYYDHILPFSVHSTISDLIFPRMTWHITSAAYYMHSNDDLFKGIEYFRNWIGSTLDYFHSSGAILFGLPISLISWVITHNLLLKHHCHGPEQVFPAWIVFLVWCGVWAFFYAHFRSAKVDLEKLTYILWMNKLNYTHSPQNPYQIWYYESI